MLPITLPKSPIPPDVKLNISGALWVNLIKQTVQSQYRYTPDGQLKVHISSNGATEQWHYTPDGALVAYTDPLLRSTTYIRDRYLRLIGMTDAEDHCTRYDYEHSKHNPCAALNRIHQPNDGVEQLRLRQRRPDQLPLYA